MITKLLLCLASLSAVSAIGTVLSNNIDAWDIVTSAIQLLTGVIIWVCFFLERKNK